MRGSQKSKLAAFLVFALVTLVVLGEIAWATMATYQLAQKNVLDVRKARVRNAITRMDNYMAGVIYPEASREYEDYIPVHAVQAIGARSDEGVELDVDLALVSSPLATRRPPADWIDLFFQVNPDGSLTSPQITDEFVCDPRVCKAWIWLLNALPRIDLGGCVARGATGDADEATVSDTQRRVVKRQGFNKSQSKYLPPERCVAPHIAAHNLGVAARGGASGLYTLASRLADIEVKTGRFAPPFWVEPQPLDGPKLAFVRQVTLGEAVAYQGFIADWQRLERILGGEIDELFPDATLEPVHDDASAEVTMTSLPVRLVVPDLPGGAAAAAWRSVRGTLITTWIAAVVVLGVAGWGLRNLVNLTERRMQFAYAVTHELRTPLTTFRLYTDMLSAKLVPEESIPTYLETLNRESQRLSTLVEDVLEYSRLENQRVRLNLTDTTGPSLLESISENLKKRCADNNIEPRIENAMTNGEHIYTDVDVVNRITSVLVANACRHTRGVSHPTVVMRLESQNGNVHVDVIDSGPGIERRDARVIFKPFRRGRKADAVAQGGIGLGLSLARNWAGLLGGHLDLAARHHPELGGAHFRLTIPRETAAS